MTGFPNSQSNPASAIPVWIAPAPNASGVSTQYSNIATSGNNLLVTGTGTFLGLMTNTAGTTSTATVYDGTDNSGNKIGTFSTTAVGAINVPGGGIPVTVGLFVVTAGGSAANVTVLFN